VVKRFGDLTDVLFVIQPYVKSSGTLVALISNLAGVQGMLARKENLAQCEKLTPHGWSAFAEGHGWAGLTVTSGA
jgi:hypothetical protein